LGEVYDFSRRSSIIKESRSQGIFTASRVLAEEGLEGLSSTGVFGGAVRMTMAVEGKLPDP